MISHRRDTPASFDPAPLWESARSGRVPRESSDAGDDLAKEGPCQVGFGKTHPWLERLFGSRGGQLLGNLDPVASLGLRPVECGIHRPKEHGSGLPVVGKRRDADGDRNGPNKLVPVRNE